MTSSSEEKRTPRKRAPRKRTSGGRVAQKTTAPKTTRVRRFSTKQKESDAPREVAAPKPEVRKPELDGDRKAPTAFASSRVSRERKKKRLLTVGAVLIIGIGTSAIVGFTDHGQIDVQNTIVYRNERIRNNQAHERDVLKSTVEVPVQNTNGRKADGGLVGRGTGGAPPPKIESAITAATSTDLTASSTEAVASSTQVVASSTDDGTPTEKVLPESATISDPALQ